MNLGFWELLTQPNSAFEHLGLPPGAITRQRQAMTGHIRPLSPTWAATIGCWGRVWAIHEIADLVGREVEPVRNHASTQGLKYATRRLRCEPHELAVGLYCDRHRAPRESARRFGVMPCERVLYLSCMQAVLDHEGTDIQDVLGWDMDRVEETWQELGLKVRLPARVPVEPQWLEVFLPCLREGNAGDARA